MKIQGVPEERYLDKESKYYFKMQIKGVKNSIFFLFRLTQLFS
ncbi:hypothetical protein [Elizabethkingia occulta]